MKYDEGQRWSCEEVLQGATGVRKLGEEEGMRISQELLLHLHARLPYAKMESCSSFLCMTVCRCLMNPQVRDLRSPSTPYPSPHRDQELVGSPG